MACSALGWRSVQPASRSMPLRGSAASVLSEPTTRGREQGYGSMMPRLRPIIAARVPIVGVKPEEDVLDALFCVVFADWQLLLMKPPTVLRSVAARSQILPAKVSRLDTVVLGCKNRKSLPKT